MAPFKLNPQTNTNMTTFFPTAAASDTISIPWYKFVNEVDADKITWKPEPKPTKWYPPFHDNMKPYIRYQSQSYALGHITLMNMEEPISTDVWLAMDGEWHSVDRFPALIKRLEMKQMKGHVLSYFIKRGKGFCLLPPSEEYL